MPFNSYGYNAIRTIGKDEFDVPSESTPGTFWRVRTVSYTTQTHGQGIDLDCSCPAYRFYPNDDGVPGCKHTERVMNEFKPVTKFVGFERRTM